MILARRRLGLLMVALAVAGGCSKGASIKTVPVSGKVTLDGNPLADANVTFLPETQPGSTATPPASTGKTGADGTYKLVTMVGTQVAEGAPSGNYKVIVTKPVATAANPMAALQGLSDEERDKKMQSMTPEERANMAGNAAQPGGGASGGKSEVPDRYGKPDESGFTAAVVSSGAQTFDFALTKE